MRLSKGDVLVKLAGGGKKRMQVERVWAVASGERFVTLKALAHNVINARSPRSKVTGMVLPLEGNGLPSGYRRE